MTDLTRVEIIFIIASALVFLLAVKRGWRRGITREIKAVVSVIVATLCLILILLLKKAMNDHTFGSVVVIGGALVILGTGWKFLKIILSPLSGFKELGIVRAVDGFLGAIAGAVESAAIIFVVYKILIQMEILPVRDIIFPWI